MTWLVSFILFAIFAPWVLVAIGLPFKVDKGERTFRDGTSTIQYDLPNWLKWLQNPEDGLTGDDRGWYWNEYMAGKPDWFKMWWWSAGRNPWNYLKRFVLGCDIREKEFKYYGDYHVRDDLKSQGWQLVFAKGECLPYFGFYYVKERKDGKGWCIQLAWKIYPRHAGEQYEDEWDYYKGFTFELNPNKDLT